MFAAAGIFSGRDCLHVHHDAGRQMDAAGLFMAQAVVLFIYSMQHLAAAKSFTGERRIAAQITAPLASRTPKTPPVIGAISIARYSNLPPCSRQAPRL